MLNIPNGVKIEYDYNCFENDTKLLDDIRDLYLFVKEKGYINNDFRDVDFYFIYNALKLFGCYIQFEQLREDYQGDAFIIFLWQGNVYLYQTSYGSCSACDIWQNNDFITNLYQEAKQSVKFPNMYELAKYLLCKDWYDMGIRKYAIDLGERIISNKFIRNKNIVEEVEMCLKQRLENE